MSRSAAIVGRMFSRSLGYLPTPSISLLPQKHQLTTKPIHNPYKEEDNLTHIGKRIVTSLEDQWAIVGVRRSGKSTFSRELLRELREAYPALRTYILDSSNDKDFRTFPGLHIESEEAPDPIRQPGAIQVWRPPIDNIESYDAWLTRILKAEQPAIVLIDELSSLGGMSGRSFPRGYFLVSKQGGKHGISLISCTQEAAYIPRVTLGQTTHVVRFRLLDSHDAKKVDKLLRRPEDEWGVDPGDKHGFFHRRTDHDGPGHYYKDHREFFGG
jgi:hypothetical protein